MEIHCTHCGAKTLLCHIAEDAYEGVCTSCKRHIEHVLVDGQTDSWTTTSCALPEKGVPGNFFACEVTYENFVLRAEEDPVQLLRALAELCDDLRATNQTIKDVRIGTVRAASVELALNEIRAGNWLPLPESMEDV